METEMLLESKLKQVAILAAVDLSLKRMKQAPERCSRNLLELGVSAYPNKISKEEKNNFLEIILVYCKSGESVLVKKIFIETFFKEQAK